MTPELSIIGAPKCGTTSVHAWLATLRGVNAAQPKETFFYMDSGSPYTDPKCNLHQHGPEAYATYFRPAAGRTLDSTTHYLYQETAAERFSDAGTKVCAILRDPTERVYSYFMFVCETRLDTYEPIDFGEAAGRLMDGTFSKLRPRFRYEGSYYAVEHSLEHGKYDTYLARWRQQMDDENLLVLTFDDLVASTSSTLRQIATFFDIEVSDADIAAFRTENTTHSPKSRAIHTLRTRWGRHLGWLPGKRGIKQAYQRLFTRRKGRFQELHPEVYRELKQYFYEHNAALARSSQLDLDDWQKAA